MKKCAPKKGKKEVSKILTKNKIIKKKGKPTIIMSSKLIKPKK